MAGPMDSHIAIVMSIQDYADELADRLEDLASQVRRIPATPRHKRRPIKYTCPECGGQNVLLIAKAEWDVEDQEFHSVEPLTLDLDDPEDFCQDCDKSIRAEQSLVDPE